MNKLKFWLWIVVFMFISLIFMGISNEAHANVRAKRLSFHFSGGYIGDAEDEFSGSGRGRFLKGYLEYGKYNGPVKIRVGRFLIYRGVALGVMDGIEIEKWKNKNHNLIIFGGMMGPKMREFEFEKFDDAMTFGGQLNWYPDNIFSLRKSKLSMSYTYQTRDSELTRHKIGLNANARLNDNVRFLSVLQLRPTSSPLRKYVGRMRYYSSDLTGLVELGVYTPDAAEASWFSSGISPKRIRVRFAFDEYIKSNEWAWGIEGTVLMVGGNSGYRLGPIFTTPFGQIGYRMQLGDLSKTEGPWINLKFDTNIGLELYGLAAMTSYEWEDFDIASQDLVMVNTGLRYKPFFLDQIRISAEYQVYQTPQFTSDRRFMGGLIWKFDTGRAGN